VLPVTRLQSTNHVEKFSGMHGVMSAPVRERMLARALARATNFERDMLTHCDRHVVSVVTLGCDKSQARFAGRGMIVGGDGNDGDHASAHEYKDDTAAALS